MPFAARTPFVLFLVMLLGGSATPPLALANEPDARGEAPPGASSPNEIEQPGEVARDDDSRLETATPDPSPSLPRPFQRPSGGGVDVVEQAGVGGPVGYSSTGVLEVGGSGTVVADGDLTSLRLAPYVGLFVHDGLALSFYQEIYADVRAGRTAAGAASVVELSVHLPVAPRLLVALAVGPGLVYESKTASFLARTRLGLDVLIGRSGILRPAFVGSWESRATTQPDGRPAMGHFRFGANLAFAAMF